MLGGNQPLLAPVFLSALSFPHFFLPSLFPSSSSSFFLLLFLSLSKIIKVRIIDDEEYEKNKTFYVEIGEPRLVESGDAKGQAGGATFDPQGLPSHGRKLHVPNAHGGGGACTPRRGRSL
ncbi:Sodium/calcium exchanger 1 [Liparis tanakae]|uniref:Sodium/calcium exchanger 1 n=1 Tax=Liparis tanakae TaxID=230148 RepID=A0A4Z2EPW2_9TELE|nr:Sodium/calcium exchanger 1 [Liparis tanakae]